MFEKQEKINGLREKINTTHEQLHEELTNITSILDCISCSENNNINLQNRALDAISTSIKNILKSFEINNSEINKHIKSI